MSPHEQLNRKDITVATMVWEGKTNPGNRRCSGQHRTGDQEPATQRF
jgi:hypothetical protein